MYLVILITLILMLGFLYVNGTPNDKGGWAAFLTVGLALGGALACMITLLGSGIFLGLTSYEKSDFLDSKLESTHKVYSVTNNVESSGSFFLGVGSFGGDLHYYYFTDGDHGKIQRSVDADISYVREYEGEVDPRLEVYDQDPSTHWITLDSYPKYYVFHVPEGSIVNQYKFND